jgi:very-short-patch-repair endonuclease
MLPKLRARRARPSAETLQLIADHRRERPTRAERALAEILGELNGGALDGRFQRECVCAGRWIVDFYFPEVQLAIEVDGGYHRATAQQGWDHYKESGLESAGVTLLRLTNEQVLGDRARLLGKLREAWRAARRLRAAGPVAAAPSVSRTTAPADNNAAHLPAHANRRRATPPEQ